MSRIRADQLVNRAGSGGPKFPHGVAEGFSVSGVVTATSFRGDGSQLTGIDASSLKDGSNVKVQAVSGGANVTGDVAATGNVTAVNATFSGDLTVQGTTTTIDTAVTEVDSLNVEGSVGIGTTNPQGKLDLRGNAVIGIDQVSGNPGTTVGVTTIRGHHVNSDSDYAQLYLSNSKSAGGGTAPTASIRAGRDSNNNGTNLSFYTNGTGSAGDGSERLRIDSSGKVGININNPGSYNSAGNELVLGNTGNNGGMTIVSGTGNNGHIFFADGTGTPNRGIIKYEHANDAMAFNTGDNERLRIDSSGHILPGADNTQDLGSSSKRFANIYTGDLNLSNEGSSNDVDGTWGQYTIQEGEDDLFLINRRTGKKYKFNLTEVD